MALNNLPKVGQSVVGKDGIATQPWYAWFGRIQSALNVGTLATDAVSAAITTIATALGSPDGTVANIPPLNFLPKTTYVHAGEAIDVSGSLATGGVDVSVADDGVTNAKLANMATGKIKARKTGSTGDPEDCSLSEVLDLVGSAANGDILIRAGGAWTRLGAGTDGHVLTLASSLPTWAAGGGGGGSGGRPYTNPAFANVSALLHMDGSNGSTTFTDQVAGNTWTANNATISTAVTVFAAQAGLFTGASNSAISLPTNSGFNVGSGDWALEFRIRPNGAHQAFARVFQTRNGDVVSGISLNFASGQTLGLQLSSNGGSTDILNSSNIGTLVASYNNSVILQRTGPVIECIINGFRTYSALINLSDSIYYNAADTVIVGGNVSGTSRSINAYLDELRFTKSVPVVGAEVTLPGSPFPDS